jgi:hypothetical protein
MVNVIKSTVNILSRIFLIIAIFYIVSIHVDKLLKKLYVVLLGIIILVSKVSVDITIVL